MLEALATRLNPDRIMAMLNRCVEADVQIQRRVQLTLVLEALLDGLCQAAS